VQRTPVVPLVIACGLTAVTAAVGLAFAARPDVPPERLVFTAAAIESPDSIPVAQATVMTLPASPSTSTAPVHTPAPPSGVTAAVDVFLRTVTVRWSKSPDPTVTGYAVALLAPDAGIVSVSADERVAVVPLTAINPGRYDLQVAAVANGALSPAVVVTMNVPDELTPPRLPDTTTGAPPVDPAPPTLAPTTSASLDSIAPTATSVAPASADTGRPLSVEPAGATGPDASVPSELPAPTP
jgi:hypothetical protein